ncbi:MAG: GGDEF domain-containing protein [Burkholderiales bacterium]|nr:GGDEF domain-containing protein [Burkholderiales bacterium]
MRAADASLVVPQMVYAVAATVLGYALVPVLRGPLLQLLCLVPLYAMLNLHPRQSAWMGGWMVALLLLMLAVMTALGRPDFVPRAEALRIALAGFVIGALTLNAMHFGRVRLQLKAQRAELTEAVGRVQDLVIHDPLTGLLNRQRMQALLQEEATRQDRSGQPLTVALIDLDFFKRINDTQGHAAGDAVLCGFADLARARLRETDAVARWGGEEFLVLLRETDIQAPALTALDRLREQLRERALVPGAPQWRLDFSAGVAARRPGESLSALLERADRALYAAKAAGRGCTVFSGSGADEPPVRSCAR